MSARDAVERLAGLLECWHLKDAIALRMWKAAQEQAIYAASRELLKRAHPEAYCQRCGGPNVVWFAPSELWNAVMGGPDGILCPMCFIYAAEAKGRDGAAWRIAPERVHAAPPYLAAEQAGV